MSEADARGRVQGSAPGWIEAARDAQIQALGGGRHVVSCSAPFGAGGLGRHLEELVAAVDRAGRPVSLVCSGDFPEGSAGSVVQLGWTTRKLLTVPPLRFSAACKVATESAVFDWKASVRLPEAEGLLAFNGQALRQIRAARALGYETATLVSANCHIRYVARQHRRAYRRYPLERPWARGPVVRRNLREYDRADRIMVSSEYMRRSFLAEGIAEERLVTFPLTPAPRFRPSGSDEQSDRFDVVYVGRLSVVKGTPLLLEAVSRLPYDDLRLTLVGGWGSRGMRRHVQKALAQDSRIRVMPGDPLPQLRMADLYVHPAFQDGFGYAPAEALASGVPVVVTEDTGMKERLEPAGAGQVVPTGDLDGLIEVIEAEYEARRA